jgi:hypothetical protein
LSLVSVKAENPQYVVAEEPDTTSTYFKYASGLGEEIVNNLDDWSNLSTEDFNNKIKAWAASIDFTDKEQNDLVEKL